MRGWIKQETGENCVEIALLYVIFSRMVGGGIEKDGCVCRGVEDSWEEKEINRKSYSNKLKTGYLF